jgi:uncharacterized protein (DUF2141 family)
MFKLTLLINIILMNVVNANELKVTFDDLRSDKGHLRYLVFNDENGFPDKPEKSVKQGELPSSSAKEGFSIDVPPGNYSVTVIHDEDSNGKLDKNFLGMPKEGFGFSNDPRIFFGPPSFKKTVFEVKGPTKIQIQVKYL